MPDQQPKVPAVTQGSQTLAPGTDPSLALALGVARATSLEWFLQPQGNAAQQEALLRQSSEPVFFDPQAQVPLTTPIVYTDSKGRTVSITSLSGHDLNLAARTIFAEVTGSGQKVGGEFLTDEELQAERQAMASVIWNRLGASGVSGGRATTLEDVLTAPNQFESVTGHGGKGSKKYRNSDPTKLRLSDADLLDLARCLDVVRELVARDDGAWQEFTSNRAGTKGKGENIGGSRFWQDDGIERVRS